MRGITSNQVSARHAFVVYLIFIFSGRLRNLEETIKIPAICENSDGASENSSDVNIVDFDCIGNQTVNSSMKLVGVEGDNLDNSTLMTNPEKITPAYTTTNLPNIFAIQSNNLDNKVFSSSPINFYLKEIFLSREMMIYLILIMLN